MADVKQDMLPDSTQGETPDQKKGTKRKGSKDGKKKKKVAKRKSKITGKRKTKSSPGSDVDSDLDLSKEKQPLEFYLHDREELINEAFIAVTGLQLSNMVPDILKYVPMDELKRLCLNQLEGLSRKRIRHIIQGTEMLSSSDSDESAPEDEAGAITMATTSVQADVNVNREEEKNDGAPEMETCVDSTVVPLTNPPSDSQKAVVESKVEDIDGVPVEVDVNIEELAFGKTGAQRGSGAVKTSSRDGVSNTTAKTSKDTSKTKSKGSIEKNSQVSSTHQRSTSRSPRRTRRRSWSSRSRSRGRYSRSRSRSRRRSWSRSRSRSRSWSRSWSRSRSRSRTRSRSPGRKEPLPADPPMPPSPPPPPPHVDAIQMRYPTPPTPSGSLSSGEIREILELESEEDEEEEEAVEDRRCREQEMRRKLEGLVGGRKGLEHKVPGKMTCVSVTAKLEDAAPGVDDDDMVVQRQSGPAESISSVSQSCEDVAAGNEEAVAMESREKAGTYLGKMSCEEDDDEEEDDSDDDEDDSDDSDDDSEEDDEDDDDINLDLLDLGVDMSKAAGQPSQLALARASIKSPLNSNATEEKTDSGEAELEVLELELRARAIRSLMHKCLKEDDKT